MELWILIPMFASFFWALTNVIDVYFVKGIYDNEYDGIIISSLFQIVPWILVPVLGMGGGEIKLYETLLAIAGGFLYMLGTFFYFRSLFAHADAALVIIIWSTVGIVTPMVEMAIFGERLNLIQYVGIVIVFLGAVIISADSKIREKKLGKIYLNMIWAVLFVSASIIVEDKAYEQLSFWNGTLFISLGSFLCGIFFWAIRPEKKKGYIIKLVKKYYKIFFLAEVLALAGMVLHYKAIETGSASIVSAIENIQPAWIMIVSWAIYFVARLLRFNNKEALQAIRNEQIAGWQVKLIAVIFMAIGLYFVS